VSSLVRNRVAVLHGVNLGALERRPAAHYGDLTYTRLEQHIDAYAAELGLDARFFQSDFEGEYVQELHKAADYADALVLNPGAWTHYAWAIRDALEIAGLPAVEVHLSDPSMRERFRRESVVRDLCLATFSGQGVEGYRAGLERLRVELEAAS
jgi:3-dehydroquinate dehydratase-2